ncbi:MAG: hypothetical protein KY054_00470 [Candidatus Nealsonbacteria bacterium]|nr:hypothetical protein [Candidatus Nealsonbacteria bacterium]
MQIFEFQFNPRIKDRRIETLSYQPKKEPEKNLGDLYILGELRNSLPGIDSLLTEIIKIIKKTYYSTESISSEEALRKSLKKVNDFLTNEISKNNVNWLGNLNLSIITLRDNEVNITKIGDIKINLIKYHEVIELSREIDEKKDQGSEYARPIVFENIVSGRINKGDRVSVLTKDVYDFFEKKGLIKELSNFPFLDKKIVEELVGSIKKDFLKISGAFFLLDTKGAPNGKISKSKPEKEVDFSMKEVHSSVIKLFSKKERRKKVVAKINIPKINFPRIDMGDNKKKGLVLLLILIIILIMGALIFQKEETSRIRDGDLIIENIIKSNIKEAQRLTSLNRRDEAFSLLRDSLKELSDFSHPEANNLKLEIEEYLKELSMLTQIEDPELVHRFELRDFVPQKIIHYRNKLYLFTPFSKEIVEIDLSNNERRNLSTELEGERGIDSASIVSNQLVFFSKPNDLFVLRNENLNHLASLKISSPKIELVNFSSFGPNMYFLDSETKEVIRYQGVSSSPQNWISSYTKKPTDIKSMSVDGYVWILNKDNTIWRYYAGSFNKNFNLNIYPFPKSISQIFTFSNLPYIYLLEPAHNRIIVTNKRGDIVKQVQSDKFNNLTHFTVSLNGKEIYLLNNMEVFKIELF